MIRTFFAIVVLSLLMTACQNDVVFSDYKTFDDILWQKVDQPEFSFDIEKEQRVEVAIVYRLIYGYPYMNMKSNVVFNNETNKKHVYQLDFQVRNEDKSYKGEIMGDFIDVRHILLADTVLANGRYNIKVEETLEEETLPFVMEVGVEVKKIDLK